MHANAHAKEKIVDRQAHAEFWEQELAAFPVRNRLCVGRRMRHAGSSPKGETIVVTCMDERNTHVDEALGIAPGAAELFASGGGKIDLPAFDAAYGRRIAAAEAAGKTVSIFLVPHECSHDPNLGCAAFANDTEAQRAFFTDLKKALKERYANVAVHVLALCTTKHTVRQIDTDAHDDGLHAALAANADFGMTAEDVAHAGHGIYIGDAYRAWVPKRNTYFNLSAFNPALAGNVGIALTVMEHHSEVDLATTPVIVHVDYPRYADAGRTDAARANIDKALAELGANPAFKGRLDAGELKIVRTETDVATWEGSLVG